VSGCEPFAGHVISNPKDFDEVRYSARRVAAEVGVNPKAFQTVIWIHQQTFLSPDFLLPEAVEAIQNVWKDASRGKYTENQARAAAIRIAKDALGKAKDPTWSREFRGLSSAELARAKAAGYASELLGRSGAGGAAAPGDRSGVAARATEELGRGEFIADSPTVEQAAENFDAIRADYEKRFPLRRHYEDRGNNYYKRLAQATLAEPGRPLRERARLLRSETGDRGFITTDHLQRAIDLGRDHIGTCPSGPGVYSTIVASQPVSARKFNK